MKAILVIDMPKRCLDCELIWDEMNNGIVRCSNGRTLDENDVFKEKPSWCPLRPIPEKKEVDFREYWYKQGWNACVDEITGEEK